MLRRSDVRLCAYRKQANVKIPAKLLHIIPLIEDILEEDTWENFLKGWDIVIKNGEIVKIIPEKDLQFAVTTCLEIKTKISLGIPEKEILTTLDIRQKNIYDIVTLNYLGDTVDWENFNLTWEIKFDSSETRLEVLNKKTKINVPIAPAKKKVVEAVEQTYEKGSIEDLDPNLLSKIKALLKAEKKD
jgi:hypothetical protein